MENENVVKNGIHEICIDNWPGLPLHIEIEVDNEQQLRNVDKILKEKLG